MGILTCLCANSIMPPLLLFSPVAMLCLFIPVILVESLVVRGMLRKPFWRTSLVVLVANILSAFAGVALLPVELFGAIIIHSDSPAELLGLLLLPGSIIAAFFLTVYVEYKWYQRRWPELPTPKARQASLVANVLTYIPLLAAMWYFSSLSFDKRMERSHRIACSSYLKQIGLALRQYADDNKGFYPPGDGAEGLELLRRNDYMYDMKMYCCPSDPRPTRDYTPPLTEDKLDYVYHGGQTTKDGLAPLAWDKPGNHKDFRNVLHCDGTVSCERLSGNSSR